MKVEVFEYKSIWKERFEQLESKLWPKISKHVISIEHVGSTSVIGLSAKDIIDLDIVLESYQQFEDVKNALLELNYFHRGNLGIEDRESFGHHNPQFSHNLYVCIQGSLALNNHICLRDHLRNSDSDKLQYSQLKLSLAKQFPNDIDAYIEGKSQFILSILKQYNFNLTDLEDIEQSNRQK
ncbi:GrpB family protein [bacterium]|nr:GrpB family protein [bacterium]